MTLLLEGRSLGKALRSEVSAHAAALAESGVRPHLAVVTATDDPSAGAYVRSLVNAASTCRIESSVHVAAEPGAVSGLLAQLADDGAVHGVILQTPLPPGLSAAEAAAGIPVAKDVDGANPLSVGRLACGQDAFAPATAVAVMELLRAHDVPLCGRHVVIVGRSTVVGKPLALLMLAADATVTICHTKTQDLPSLTRGADVLVVAAGRQRLIGLMHVNTHSVVIDVGTNVDPDGNLAGDVDEAIEGVVAARSPVPGGVGPVTTAVLLRHVVSAAGTASR